MNTIWFHMGLSVRENNSKYWNFLNDILLQNRMWCKICDVKHKKLQKIDYQLYTTRHSYRILLDPIYLFVYSAIIHK